jgi:hypothetical protein
MSRLTAIWADIVACALGGFTGGKKRPIVRIVLFSLILMVVRFNLSVIPHSFSLPSHAPLLNPQELSTDGVSAGVWKEVTRFKAKRFVADDSRTT